jgi:hypothetical protein
MELMQLPWRENSDIVQHFFIRLTTSLSKESQLQVLQQNKKQSDYISRLLDRCVSQIDHSMLSNIIAA